MNLDVEERAVGNNSGVRPDDGSGDRRGQQAGGAAESPLRYLREQAQSIALEAGDKGKSAAAEELRTFADQLRKSSENWQDRHAWMRGLIDGAAAGVEQVSGTLAGKDLRSFFADAESAARRNPVLVAACAVAVGFAIVRFLKSAEPELESAGPGLEGNAR
jgi:hypothetical protein